MIAIQNVRLSEISKFFSVLYPASWLVGADAEYGKTLRKAWLMSLDGLSDEQINYAIDRIAKATTPYQKFPPNPQEFRALCLCLESTKEPNVLEIEYMSREEEESFTAFWRQCLDRLKENIPQQQFSQCISPLQATYTGERVILFAPNQYVFENVHQNYLKMIEYVLCGLDSDKFTKIVFIVGAKGERTRKEKLSENCIGESIKFNESIGNRQKINENILTQNNTEETFDDPQYAQTG